MQKGARHFVAYFVGHLATRSDTVGADTELADEPQKDLAELIERGKKGGVCPAAPFGY
jgi:hypothetical protein